MSAYALRTCVLLGGLAASVTVAHAGSLRVGPTLITLDEACPVAVVRVTNNNTVTTAIDVRANAWTQANNEDAFDETQKLIVTPPVFEIAPGETQTVRVGLNPETLRGLGGAEQAFRLFVSELPRSDSGVRGTQMLMRVGVPVFISPGHAKPELVWNLQHTGAHAVRVQVTNRGAAHARIVRMALRAGDRDLAGELSGRYVLPGASRTWTVPISESAASLAQLNLDVEYVGSARERIEADALLSPTRPDSALAASAR